MSPSLLEPGAALPPETRTASTLRILQFCGATWMWGVPIFYDPAAAAATGLDGPVVPGEMKSLYLLAYLRRWLAGRGAIRRLQVTYRRPDYHNTPLTMGGQITRIDDPSPGGRTADLELWVENAAGERTVRASATVHLRA